MHSVEVAAEEEVGVSVTVDVSGEYSVDRRELRLSGKRNDRKRSIAVVPHQGCRERVRVLGDGLPELSGRKDIGDFLLGVRRLRRKPLGESRERLDHLLAP